MTAQQMKERVRLWLDQQNSPRFDGAFHYDQALNTAQHFIIQDRIDNIKINKKYFFEAVERVRSELYTIVKTAPIIPSGNLLAMPADFQYELMLYVTINGVKVPSKSVTYNEYQELFRNAFEEPNNEYPVHYRDQNGIHVDFGTTGAFTLADFSYTFEPPNIDTTTPPFVDCILPSLIHEEVCVMAANVLMGTVENYRKEQMLKMQQMSQ